MSRPSPEQCAEIARLHYAEHWKVGTIAAQLGLHPDVIENVLGVGKARAERTGPRPTLIEPYVDFVAQTLATYPTLRATRLYDMLRERGYRGGVRNLREYVRGVRPRPRKEVYLRTEPMVGEQAQIDWAYVGKLTVDGTERALWLFVMVLAWSRALWGEFVIDLTVHSLCRSLVGAARAFGGVTRQWLFDNPKIVVLERRGDAVRFHPRLLELCGALRVQPRLCAVRRPEHKGRVERSIRYLRERFLAGRIITSVADGNRALARFIDDIGHARPHPALAPRTVGDAFADEKPRLLALPRRCPRPSSSCPPTSIRRHSSASTPTAIRSPQRSRIVRSRSSPTASWCGCSTATPRSRAMLAPSAGEASSSCRRTGQRSSQSAAPRATSRAAIASSTSRPTSTSSSSGGPSAATTWRSRSAARSSCWTCTATSSSRSPSARSSLAV